MAKKSIDDPIRDEIKSRKTRRQIESEIGQIGLGLLSWKEVVLLATDKNVSIYKNQKTEKGSPKRNPSYEIPPSSELYHGRYLRADRKLM